MCYQNKHIQDDAFITFRYANNFIDGHGLVFNIGERVEGFTSILWVLILSSVKILGLDLVGFSQISGVALGILSIWITFLLTKLFFSNNILYTTPSLKGEKTFFGALVNLLPATMLAFTGAFQYWAISGMEVTLFISFFLISIYLYLEAIRYEKPLTRFSVFISIASLVRPEAVLLFIVLILHFWFRLYKKHENIALNIFFREIVSEKNRTPILIFFLTNFALLIFRLFYYGFPLPNTFYAKTGLSYEYLTAGLDYIYDFFKTYLLYGTILFSASLLFINKEAKQNIGLLLSIIMIFIIYSIVIGGDVLPLFRFVLPVLPLIYILFIKSFLTLGNVLQKRIKNSFENLPAIGTIIISLLIIYYNYITPKEKIEKYSYFENQLVKKMSASGKWLAQKQIESERKLIVAATTIGAVSYYSNARVIDMLGLTDATIAHNPKPIKVISGSLSGWKERNYNIDYLLSQEPDYIYFSTGLKPSAYAERALFLSEDFVNNYYPYFFNAIENYVETIYKRKSPAIEKNKMIRFSENSKFDSNYVNLYNNLLNIKNKPEFRERALSICEQIKKIGPVNFTGAEYQLGLLYEKEGNKENGFRIMEDAADKDDYLSLAHFYLGRHYSIKKNIPLAKTHFELVQKYNPDYFNYQTRHRQKLEN